LPKLVENNIQQYKQAHEGNSSMEVGEIKDTMTIVDKNAKSPTSAKK